MSEYGSMATLDGIGESDSLLNSRRGDFKAADENQVGNVNHVHVNEKTEEPVGCCAKFTSLIARGVKAGFNDFIRLMTVSKINVLMIFIPAVLVMVWGEFDVPAWVLFICSALGIIPLAAFLSILTEDIATRTNVAIGALINVTFGNATELIVSTSALRKEEYRMIANALTGSMLGTMLFVQGTCFIIAGIRNPEARHNVRASRVYTASLLLSTLAFVIPTVFEQFYGDPQPAPPTPDNFTRLGDDDSHEPDGYYYVSPNSIGLSREISFVLVVIYGLFIFFQVGSHKKIFDADAILATVHEAHVEERKMAREEAEADKKKQRETEEDAIKASLAREEEGNDVMNVPTFGADQRSTGSDDSVGPSSGAVVEEDANEEAEDDGPQYSLAFAILAVGGVALTMSVLSDTLVDTMTEAADSLKVGFTFTSMVLAPVVGNVAEFSTSIMMARRGKVDIAMGVALGSSIQISTFVMPMMVILSFALGKEFSLCFKPFIAICVVFAVMLAYFITSAGSTTWLSGVKLVTAYVVFAMTFRRLSEQ